MSKPLVSAFVPCFRMKRYLQRFLEALPQQTFFDRLQVVLDHNEPEAEEIEWVRKFQSKYPGRLKHIVVEKVDPIGVSMNRAIRESDSDLLAIWNVDDLRTANSIELQAEFLSRNADVDIAYGDYEYVSSFGATHGRRIKHGGIPPSEFTRSMIFGPFFMFRKALCEKAGHFDEQLKSGADFDLSIRLALNGRSAMVDGSLGYYLDEGLGASTRPNSLQPIERTVIELRYGIYDKIEYEYVAGAARYNIPYLLRGSEWVHVGNYIPEYEQLMRQRQAQWNEVGLNKFRAGKKNKKTGWTASLPRFGVRTKLKAMTALFTKG